MRRTLRYGSNAALSIIIFGAILIIGYLIVMNHSRIWDLTGSHKNTLDPKTLNTLKSLDFDVRIKAFCNQGQERQGAKDILDLYKYTSDRVSYEIIDPDMHPNIAKAFGIERYGQAVIIGNSKQEGIDVIAEEEITNAILKLKRDKKKTVYFLTGHGEKDISDTQKDGISYLKDALQRDNYIVKTLMLMREQVPPKDADLLLIIGPNKTFFKEEIASLEGYLLKGGNMFIAGDPMEDAGLKRLLDKYGIVLDSGIIIDKFSRILGGDYMVPVVSTYGNVKELQGFRYATFFPGARGLEIKDSIPEDLKVQWLARTSDQSWSEHDIDMLNKEGKAILDGEDKKGPLNIALFVKKKIKEDRFTQLVVFGDSDFLSNAYLMVSGNKDLAMNCINMLLEEKDLITIEKKAPSMGPFILTPVQAQIIFWLPIVIIPSIILATGIWVFFSRRRT